MQASISRMRQDAVAKMQKGDYVGAIRHGLVSFRAIVHACGGTTAAVQHNGEILPECLLLAKAYTKVGDRGEAQFYLRQAASIAGRDPYADAATNVGFVPLCATTM